MASQTKFGALEALLKNEDVKGSLFDPNKAKRNKQRRYNQLMRGLIYPHILQVKD